jgi:AraC family transcriptional regulator
MAQRTSSYADYYRRGPYRNLSQTHPTIGGSRVRAFMVLDRPAGIYDEPAFPAPTLQIALAGRRRCRLDLGAGRFGGIVRSEAWIVTPAGQTCHYELESPLDLLVLELQNDFHREQHQPIADFSRLHGGLHYGGAIVQIARQLWSEMQNPSGLGPLWIDSALLTIVGLLSRQAGMSSIEHHPTLRPRGDWRVRRCLELMEANLGQDIGIEELSAAVQLSSSQIAQLFRAAVGMPPHRWLMKRRIENACALLQDSRYSITEIAHASGFASSQHLATVFRKHRGTTPSEFRHSVMVRGAVSSAEKDISDASHG